MKLILERKQQSDETVVFPGEPIEGQLLLTPSPDADYWTYRVKVSDTQAVLGFPKFGSIGIGFSREESWNTNLPATRTIHRNPGSGVYDPISILPRPPEELWEHIEYEGCGTSKEVCMEAIRLIQEAVFADNGYRLP